MVAPPEPWRRVLLAAVGGLVAVGFASAPDDGRDLVMVVSHNGLGLYDAVSGEWLAREYEPDDEQPGDDLRCDGIGPLEGVRVPTAGLFGGGLDLVAHGGWSLTVDRSGAEGGQVVLLADGAGRRGAQGAAWWRLFGDRGVELRAAGFSPSGRTLAVATTADLTLWSRA